ncbi:MAG: hypothetical protein WCC25_20040 [Candidatus Korobacteraceae bacterium]
MPLFILPPKAIANQPATYIDTAFLVRVANRVCRARGTKRTVAESGLKKKMLASLAKKVYSLALSR